MNTRNIPDPKGVTRWIHESGYTLDIMNVIMKWEVKGTPELEEFCRQFSNKSPRAALKAIHDWMYDNIQYREDPKGKQIIKSPSVLWADRVGDCKSFSVFIACCMNNLGIPGVMRFVAYQSGDPTHVYPVAIINGKELPVDVVASKSMQDRTSFGKELGYHHKIDKPMKGTKIAEMYGVPRNVHVGASDPTNMKNIADWARERTEYVRNYIPRDYIPFDKINVASALLRLSREELKVFAKMDQANSAAARRGIALIDRAIADVQRGVTPHIPAYDNDLAGVAARIRSVQNMQQPAANSAVKAQVKKYAKLGVAGVRMSDLSGYIQETKINRNIRLPGGPILPPNYDFRYHYFYGNQTQFAQSDTVAKEAVDRAKAEFGYDNNSSTFPRATEMWDVLDIIIAPIQSAWINDTFKDEIGTTVLYQFCDSTTREPVPQQLRAGTQQYIQWMAANRLTIADFPERVQVKQVFQNNYLQSISTFSGLDQNIVNNLARVGIVRTATGQPEDALRGLFTYGMPNIAIDPATIALITAIISAIAGGIGAVLTQINKTRAFQTQNAFDWLLGDKMNAGNSPSETDFPPMGPPLETGGNGGAGGGGGVLTPGTGAGTGTGNGGGAGTGTGTDLLPIVLLGGAAALLLSKK